MNFPHKLLMKPKITPLRSLGLVLVLLILLGVQLPYDVNPVQAVGNTVITITPDQMNFVGDVATRTNTVGRCTENWLSTMPAGSIILGIDPSSCNPLDWDGASASVNVYLPNIYAITVYVLELSWPDQNGKGLRSPLINQTTSILFDNYPVWSKRTTDLGSSGEYYGAQHEPIKTTLVVNQSGTHTLSFLVPQKTAWDLSTIKLTAYAMSSKIKGIGYSPYRDCQYPGGADRPGVQDIQDDLSRLLHTSNAIRTYSSTGVNSQVPALANAMGLPVFAGAWLDYPKSTLVADQAEIQGIINAAKNYHLDGVIVGNEYYLRHRTQADIEYLRQKIVQVKNNIPPGIPVTTAEIDDLMFVWTDGVPSIREKDGENYRPILDAVDIVMVHIYPFWSGLPIDGAAAYTVARYQAIKNLIEQEYPGQHKRVIIGEAGWPSAGEPQLSSGYPGQGTGTPPTQAIPSLQNQRRYLLEFLSLAEQQGVEYFYFDAFDELWKIEESGHVGQNWGYSYSDRSAKHSFYGILLPTEDLTAYLTTLISPQQTQNQSLSANITTANSQPFSVYSEWPEGPEHFVPSGWMGDISSIGIYGCDRSNPHSGEMAMRISYSPTGNLGWAGVNWQYPENNWGNINASLDLSWANKLIFWARGAQGGEKVKFMVGGIGTAKDQYPDSLRPAVSTGFIQLTNEWQMYTIDLRGRNLTHLIGGFGWVTDKCANPAGATFYVDDVFFEYDPNMPPPPDRDSKFPVYTDAAAQDNHFIPSVWLGDGAVPGRMTMNECWADNPHGGHTDIKITYAQKGIGWAGMYWVDPTGNVGDRPGGVDLSSAIRLTFWARTDTPGAQVKFIIGGIGYGVDWAGNALCNQPNGPFPDSACPKIEKTVTLNSNWTKYNFDLTVIDSEKLNKVVGGFGWVSTQPLTLYLDDIIYELGFINITGNVGVAGATLMYNDGTLKTIIADGTGNYSITVPYRWDGLITPYKAGYKFYPNNQKYSKITLDQNAQDYVASQIPPPPSPIQSRNDGHVLELRPTFEWSPVSGAMFYDIEVSKDNLFKNLILRETVEKTNYTPSEDLPVTSKLYWRVRAISLGGAGKWSETRGFDTPNPPGIPILTLPNRNASIINFHPQFTWSRVWVPHGTQFDYYQIQVSNDLNFSALAIDEKIFGLSSTMYQSTTYLPINATYYWRLRAVNSLGESSSWSEVRTFSIPGSLPGGDRPHPFGGMTVDSNIPAPAVNTPLNQQSIMNRLPVLDWSDVDKSTCYYLQVSTDPSFDSSPLLVSAFTIESGYDFLKQVPENVTLYWRVRVIIGNRMSDWSSTFTFRTP